MRWERLDRRSPHHPRGGFNDNSHARARRALIDINATSIEHSHLSPRELMLTRIAALVAVDPPPGSCLANAGPAVDTRISQQDVQEIMIAVAPLVGTAKVVSASGNLMRALGFAIAVADEASSA
jgi:hypothetical protein